MSFRFRPVSSVTTAMMLASAVLLSLPALAEENPANADSKSQPSTPATVTWNGLTVFYNPETGRIEAPSDEKLAKMREAYQTLLANRATALGRLPLATDEVEVERLDNGLLRARLTADYLNFSVVRIGENGEMIHGHGKGLEGVERLLEEPVSAQQEVE